MKLADLELSPAVAAGLMAFLTERESGLLVVCGPTGAGKTATVSALLGATGRGAIALESRLSAEPANGVIVDAGDIRSAETAMQAVEVAKQRLTVGIVRAVGGVGVLRRLEDMAVNGDQLARVKPVVLTQQLCGRLCRVCAVPWRPDRNDLRLFAGLGKQLELTDGWLYRSVGCSQCIDGYSGKVAVTQLKHWGDEDGTDALVRDGLVKLMAGLTTLAELERVLL